MDDDYTARAAIRQPAPAGCWVAAHSRLAGVDDDYTARAAIRQPTPAGCWVAAHRRLDGVDDDYTARAAILQLAPAGCWMAARAVQRLSTSASLLCATIQLPVEAGRRMAARAV